jgi:hypothetical protein
VCKYPIRLKTAPWAEPGQNPELHARLGDLGNGETKDGLENRVRFGVRSPTGGHGKLGALATERQNGDPSYAWSLFPRPGDERIAEPRGHERQNAGDGGRASDSIGCGAQRAEGGELVRFVLAGVF